MKIIATGLRFPEGPIAMRDGSILLVEIERQTLSRVQLDGRVDVVAQIPGGPNGAALGPGGCVYVCNNGGMSWSRSAATLRPHGVPDNYEGGGIDVVDLSTGRVDSGSPILASAATVTWTAASSTGPAPTVARSAKLPVR